MRKLFKALRHLVQKKHFIPTIAGLLLITLACWLQSRPNDTVNFLLDRIHYLNYDARFKLTTKKPPKGYTPIVIADIDEKSLAELGRWPWPRHYLAKLVDQLFNHGAVIIAFDMLLSEPEKNITDLVLSKLIAEDDKNTQPLVNRFQRIAPHFDHDKILAKSLASGETVLGFVFHNNTDASNGGSLPSPFAHISPNQSGNYTIPNYLKHQGNLAILQQASGHGGAITVQPDEDGIVRRAPLVFRNGNLLYPSLSLQAARLFLLEDKVRINTVQQGDFTVMESVNLGKKVIPTDHQGNVLVPFMGPAHTFPYVSAVDVINNDIPPNQLQGALVFIGTSAFGLNDLKATAIDSIFPGVEVHATIAHNILKGYFPYVPHWELGAQMTVTVLTGLLLMFILPYCRTWGLVFTASIALSSIIGLETYLWFAQGMVISLVVPIFLILLFFILHLVRDLFYEAKHCKKVETLFSQYVPPNYLKAMLKSGCDHGFQGDNRNMTVLFSDIRNFTTISESLNVTELKDLLNQFFSEMTEIIFKHKGTIDKYVGDMVMAFWGAPMNDPEHAKHALAGGLAMLKRTEELKARFQKQGFPEINIGVGLNSGPMNVGDMGSKFRRSYTVLGDTVNLGSRCEALTKNYGVKIIIAENTQQACPDYIVRQLDKIRVKGKKEGITLYEPIGLNGQVATDLPSSIDEFHAALALYYQQHWDEAEQKIRALSQHTFHQHLCHLYLQRIKNYRKNPPGEDWDGVYTALSKSG